MPFYDYLCKKCDYIMEVRHGMSECPVISCEFCGSQDMEKMIAQINLNTKTGQTHTVQQMKDKQKSMREMKQDLRENYEVHEVSITQKNTTYENIYKEIKGNGTEVRDTMKEQRKRNQEKSRKKLIENNKNFAKIRDKRILEVKERMAKESYEKRAINPIKESKKED